MIASDITKLIGHTPMVSLHNIRETYSLNANIIAKLEYFNPGGSAKDRIALAMIDDAERRGILKPGGTIIEPTSGNTGIGLAMVCAARGYKLILTMPDTMSIERRMLLKAYGATIELTPGNQGMNGAISMAKALRDSIKGAVIMGQFDNAANPQAHYMTTANEIIHDCRVLADPDYFVAGVGTGGTVSGTSRRLKEVYPSIKAVAVEPAASAVLEGGKPGAHALQGIGAGFIPDNYDASVVDEVIAVGNEEAMECARVCARNEGILVGISSGAALCAAIKIARRAGTENKNIIVLLPDSGERYLSTSLFNY